MAVTGKARCVRGGRSRGRKRRVSRGLVQAVCGDLDRLADAGQGDGPLAQDAARADSQVLQLDAVRLVGLLEAVDQGAALDGRAAADRVDPPVGVGPAGRQVQAQGDHVARLPPAHELVVGG